MGRLGRRLWVQEEKEKPEPREWSRVREEGSGPGLQWTVGMRRSEGGRTAQWLGGWVGGKPGRGTGFGAVEGLPPPMSGVVNPGL